MSPRPRDLSTPLVVDADRDLAVVVDDLVQDPMHRALVRREGELAGLLSVTDAARLLEALLGARAAQLDAAPARRAASEDPAPLAVGRG